MAMSLSLAVTASASYNTFDDQAEIVNDEAVFLLNALGIVEGRETGDFDPAANINRAEAAKLVAALNLAGVPVPEANGVSSFEDVLGDGSVAWANDYIEYCVSQGSVNGIGNDLFAPKANVTGVQFAKMLLGILGYKADVEEYTGANWEYNVNIDAVKAGLYIGLKALDVTAPLSRDDAAQMMYNALKAFPVIYLTDTTGALKLSHKNLLETIYPTVYGNQGILDRIDYNTDKGVYTYYINGKALADTTSADYTDMLGMNVMYVMDRIDGVLGLYAYNNGAVTTGLWGDFDKAHLTKDKLLDTDFAERLFVVGPDHAYNVAAEANKLTGTMHDYYEYKLIDNDDNGKYDYLIVYPIKDAEVTISTKDGIKADVVYKYEDCTIESGLAVGDMAMIEEDTTLKTEFVISELALEKGTVDHFVSNNDYITNMVVGSANYDICRTADHQREVAPLLAAKKVSFNVINGYAVNVAIDDSIALSELLLVTAIEEGYDEDYTYDAKAMFSDGSIKPIDISKLNGSFANVKTLNQYMETTATGNYVGVLAKYDEVSGAYELTTVGYFPSAGALGFDGHSWDCTFAPATRGDDDAAIKVGNTEIEFADDAIIYLADVSGKETVYSVATGADMATLTGVNTVYYAGWEKAADGHNYITFAFIKTDSISESADNYGILTSDVVWYDYNDKNVDYATFTIWNGTEEVSITAEVGEMVEFGSAYREGHVIKYSTNDGKIINMNYIAGTEVSVDSYNVDNYQGILTDKNGNKYDITDAVVISSGEGVSAEIFPAEKVLVDGADTFIKNVKIYTDASNAVYLVIVDAEGIDVL